VSYIKISDPSIIDLAAWQQVINVVNQHSDSITAITNNFGAGGATDYTVPDVVHIYDSGSQSILYGKTTGTVGSGNLSSGAYYGTVTFANVTHGINSFSNPPIVTATIQNSSVSTNDDMVVSIYGVTPTQFSYKVYRSRQGLATLNSAKSGVTTAVSPVDPSGTFYINWTAIGPK
jgi:hypothetical protein